MHLQGAGCGLGNSRVQGGSEEDGEREGTQERATPGAQEVSLGGWQTGSELGEGTKSNWEVGGEAEPWTRDVGVSGFWAPIRSWAGGKLLPAGSA